MTEKYFPFYPYRYLVTSTSLQISTDQPDDISKEELMIDIINNLSNNKKTAWMYKSKRYLFYGLQSLDNVHIIKYARETNENIYIEGENDIEIQGIKEAKYIFLIIDTKHQIILLEKNRSVFNTLSTSTEILANFFREKMRKYDYVVNIYPLVSKKNFWNYVESADNIFELSLELNAPNLALFGHEETGEVLKDIKKATNNDVFDISIKSREGKLKIAKETLGKWIEYVQEVGGKYFLKFSKNKIARTKTSDDDIAKTYLPKKRKGKYTKDEIMHINDKLVLIDKLENRNEKEEDI